MEENGYNDNHIGDGPAEALGQSEAFLAFQERLSQVAHVDRPILIIGERGTGKELAASRLHFLSPRWQSPLVALNCSALSPTLIESELFGHEAGAFTGATGRRAGRFEAADSGTLFLDEIGTIPMETQEKILRVVEYGSFERVGGSRSINVNVRIVAATNADLPGMASRGEFKADLLDRLSFEVLTLPPLRERMEDIMLLANHFAARMAYELGREDVPEFTDAAVAALEQYDWPGNVRELKNVVERAVYRASGPEVEEINFNPFESPYVRQPVSTAKSEGDVPVPGAPSRVDSFEASLPALGRPLKEAIRDLELGMVQAALEQARYNQREAADLLGLSYHQFRGLYRKYQGELGE